MRNDSIWRAGLITGTMLGLLLCLLRWITGYPLDRILLDLSYLPLLAPYNNGVVQWTAHLLTAVAVFYMYERIVQRVLPRRLATSVLYGSLVSLIYFALAPLAAPEVGAAAAPFLPWWLCHAIYGALIHFMTERN